MDGTPEDQHGSERFETVIIGGGQAGLSMGYHLAARDRPFVILDANERIGDAWRTRWDSLRLFTPARYDGLEGLRFPGPALSFPTKDEMADYLEAYAKRFELPVRTGMRVDGLSRLGERYVITAGDRRFEADHVVVATGAHHSPTIPSYAGDLDPGIVQLHSRDYRGPSQLREGASWSWGSGTGRRDRVRGRSHASDVAGRHALRPDPRPSWSRRCAIRVPHRAIRRPPRPAAGDADRPEARSQARVGRRSPHPGQAQGPRRRGGREQVARTAGTRDGLPILGDDRILEAANVIWCTGFHYDFGWIDLQVFDEHGAPLHRRGVVEREPGLYFMGLVFQYAVSSDVLPGMSRDARYIASHIAARTSNDRPPAADAA